jgi:hypothetical protein
VLHGSLHVNRPFWCGDAAGWLSGLLYGEGERIQKAADTVVPGCEHMSQHMEGGVQAAAGKYMYIAVAGVRCCWIGSCTRAWTFHSCGNGPNHENMNSTPYKIFEIDHLKLNSHVRFLCILHARKKRNPTFSSYYDHVW